MNTNIDISLLFKRPNTSQRGLLIIQPLAPLSMVSSIPGSYYRTLGEPDNHMLYGMLENLLGWHFSDDIRKKVIKAVGKHYKKEYKDLFTESYESSENGFTSLLQNHLKITKSQFLPKAVIERYEDYWTQHLKDSDRRHLGGARNYDWRLEPGMNVLADDDAKNTFFKINKSNFPKYYSSPKKREFVVVQDRYWFQIETNEEIMSLLTSVLQSPESPIYLGTNEGWIDINIKKL